MSNCYYNLIFSCWSVSASAGGRFGGKPLPRESAAPLANGPARSAETAASKISRALAQIE